VTTGTTGQLQAFGEAVPGGLAAATVATIAARVAKLPALPPDDRARYSVRRLTVSWLAADEARRAKAPAAVLAHPEKLGPTAIAHLHDLTTYLHWCEQERLDPLSARPADIVQYTLWRALHGHRQRTAKPATLARALTSLSSWYTCVAGSADPGLHLRNPVDGVDRPKPPRKSPTVGLTQLEVDVLLEQAAAVAERRAAAAAARPGSTKFALDHLAALRDHALLHLLANLGLRVNEALARDLGDLRFNAGGWRTLYYIGKRGEPSERAPHRDALADLDRYLAARAAAAGVAPDALTGPLFATTGTEGQPGRLTEAYVFRWLRRLAAAAGLPTADRLSPHSLRHALVTASREEGIPLQDVQDAMGHADPRTTQRYDRAGFNPARDPAQILGELRAQRRAPAGGAAPRPAPHTTAAAAARIPRVNAAAAARIIETAPLDDVVDVLADMPAEQAADRLDLVGSPRAGAVLAAMDETRAARLLSAMTGPAAAAALQHMPADAVARVTPRIPPGTPVLRDGRPVAATSPGPQDPSGGAALPAADPDPDAAHQPPRRAEFGDG
jgi:integrase/recombinase XerD